ncbi:MAG TPA: OmpA family protein [Candidatus Aminicenantes bacterium]|nr:OmpA family protein [Candidatus Aminicenantes bacterium]
MQARRLILAAGVVILAGLTAFTGCATKKYVHEELASLDQKVEGVETSIEENQKRIKEHDERLETLGSLITQHDAQFKSVDGKIEEVKKFAQGKLIFKETLRNKEAKFKVDSFELGPEAQTILDKFVEVLIAQDKGVYLEIQGHTDTTGPENWNLLLGKKRAEAVMDYLYKRHHIPLHRMQVISYGSSAPVAENSNREGRARNRRVEILVYE